MKKHNTTNKHMLQNLIFEYEAMSQQGTVGFYEETVFFDIIEHYEKENLPDKALEVIEHALLQHSFTIGFYIRKSQILIDKGCAHLALECLEKAEAFSPNGLEIQFLKIEALVELEYYEDAIGVLNYLKTNLYGKDLSEVFFYEAVIYENLENFDRMFAALKESLNLNPRNSNSLERIWLAVELSDKHKQSIQLHLMIIDHDPYNHIAWYNLGHSYAYLQDYENAIEAFEYAYIIDKKFEFAYRECADACIKSGNYQKALRCFEDALEQIKPDSDIFKTIGQCYNAISNLTLAKSFYRKALDMDPLNSEVHFLLGECYAREERWQSAVKSYEKAMNIDDKIEEYIAALAEAYYQTGQEAKAYSLFQKAADTAPETTKYWIQFASFLMETGASEEALEVLEEAQIYAEGTELLYCRIACLFELARRQEALFQLSQALIENYHMYPCLFDLQPTLENDREVLTVIAAYQAD